MGVYTYLEQTLGLKVTPFLTKIKEKLEAGEAPEQKDWMELLNVAARYETLSHRFQFKKVTFEGIDKDSNDEVISQLGDMMMELNNVRFSQVNIKRDYMLHIQDSNYALSKRMGFHDLMKEIDSSFTLVKDTQKNFDKNEDNLRVIGILDYLKRDYGMTFTIMAHQDREVIKKEIAEAINGILVKEIADKQAFLHQMAEKER